MRPDKPIQFDPSGPVADGIRFDDITLTGKALRDALIARGLVWRTSFTDDRGTDWAGSVIAASPVEAARIADARGLGETIDGPMTSLEGVDD